MSTRAAAATTQDSIFFRLPAEKQVEVFEFVLSSDNNLEARLVCRDWLGPLNEAVRSQWVRLKVRPPDGPFNMGFALGRVEKQFLVNGRFPDDFNYLNLFRALNRVWKTRDISIPYGELVITCAFQSSLQNTLYRLCLDRSLMAIWGRIWPSLSGFVFQLSKPDLVRQWFECPMSAHIRESVISLNLADLGMRYLPIELSCFPNLRILKLSHNHLEFLPPFLAGMKELRILDLQDNLLEELPEGFPNWTHLEFVNLNENDLNPKGKAQFQQLIRNLETLAIEDDQMEINDSP